jgi:WD40 repeat protein
MAFSPDGATFAVGTADGTVYRWKLGAPNSSPDTLEGHEGRVSSLAFNRSGQLLASGGFDSTVRIWDLRQGAHPTILKLRSQHTTSPVLSVAFSDDGRTVFSSSASETMLSWIGPAEELTESTGVLAEQVCKRVARNLTTNEWTQYVAQYVGTNQAPKCTCTNLPPCEQVAQRSSAARQ